MKDVRTVRCLWDRMRVCPQAVSHSDSVPQSLVPGEAWDRQQADSDQDCRGDSGKVCLKERGHPGEQSSKEHGCFRDCQREGASGGQVEETPGEAGVEKTFPQSPVTGDFQGNGGQEYKFFSRDIKQGLKSVFRV